MLEQVIRENVITYTLMALSAIGVLILASFLIKEKTEALKYALFGTIVLIILANTIYLIGSTLYLNAKSITNGPVHYHADFQIWDCGNHVDIIDPTGLSNKVGTPTFHEHNDNRIHVEGVILDQKDVSLGHFFEVTGGSMSSNGFQLPTVSGMLTRQNGDLCNGVAGEFQVFVYKTVKNIFYQEKLTDPANYVLSYESKIPPGDCIIMEFGPKKDFTDKICDFYQVAIQKGEITER